MKVFYATVCVILLVACVYFFKLQNQNNQTLLTQKDVNSYIGKEVSDLINRVNSPVKKYSFTSEPPGMLAGCNYVFANGVRITIYIKPPKYQEKFRRDFKWDLSLFNKETITRVRLEFSPRASQ